MAKLKYLMNKTYYVSSIVGNDESSGGSKRSAFATLQKAADVAGAGDTVLVMPGEYVNADPNQNVLTIYKSGRANAPITFKAFDTRNKPVINVRNYQGIQVLGSYVNIDGFVIAGNRKEFENLTIEQVDAIQKADGRYSSPITSGNGIAIGNFYNNIYPDHVKISNSIIRDNTGGGIAVIRSDYVTIENNQVYGNSYYSPYATSGISFYQSGNSDNNTGVKIIVRGNTVYGNKNLIKNFNNFSEDNLNHPDPSKRPQITDGNGIIIDDNARTQVVQSVDGDKQSKDLPAYKGKTLIENNRVFDNGGQGILAFNSDSVIVRKNTVFNNHLSPEVAGGEITSTVTGDAKAKGAGQNIIIQNNIITPAIGKIAQSFYSESDRTIIIEAADPLETQPLLIRSGDTNHNDLVGYYKVKDTSGSIVLNGKTLLPGQVGYAQAAVKLAVQDSLTVGTSQSIGDYYAPVLISNGDFQSFLAKNPNNNYLVGRTPVGQRPIAYFAFANANPDKLTHIRGIGENKIAFEDSFGLNNRDFNDVVLQLGGSANILATTRALF
jgi:parallel beta-helix repeat protein